MLFYANYSRHLVRADLTFHPMLTVCRTICYMYLLNFHLLQKQEVSETFSLVLAEYGT